MCGRLPAPAPHREVSESFGPPARAAHGPVWYLFEQSSNVSFKLLQTGPAPPRRGQSTELFAGDARPPQSPHGSPRWIVGRASCLLNFTLHSAFASDPARCLGRPQLQPATCKARGREARGREARDEQQRAEGMAAGGDGSHPEPGGYG